MQKLVKFCAAVCLSAVMFFSGSPAYIAKAEQNAEGGTHTVIDAAPPVPSITKFSTVDWDAGWYRMESDLRLGTVVYTVDLDPNNTEYLTEKEEDFEIVSLSEKYIGSDYIVSRRKERQAIFFRAEQDIYVYAAVDSRYSSALSWLSGWSYTGDTMQIRDGTSYRIYERAYAEGLVYINKIGNDSDVANNYFLMVLPQNGFPVSKMLTDNPVIAEGSEPKGDDKNDGYVYYINDVFGQESLPQGYTAYGETEGNGVSVRGEELGGEERVNFALNAKYTTNSNTRNESPVDGNTDTYWQSDGFPGELNVDLGQVRTIDTLVLRLRNKDTWANRTQRLEVTGSADGEDYSVLVAQADYEFITAEGNYLTFRVAANVRYLRVTIYSNTEHGGAQLSEIEAIGTESDRRTERNICIEKGAYGAQEVGIDRKFEPTSGKTVIETRVKTDGNSRDMQIPGVYGADGACVVSVCFGKNGYIRANGTDIMPYEADVWYSVRLILDAEKKTFDVYIDHLCRAEGEPFAESAGDIGKIRFSAAERSDGKLEIDYLRAFDYTQVYLFEEEFNDLPTGTRPDGWTITGGSADVTEFPFPEDKSLKIQSDGSRTSAERSFDPLQGDVTIEAKVRPVQSGWVTAPLVSDASGGVAAKVALFRNSIFISNGNNWVYVCDQEIPNNYYGADNWFYIKIVLNTYTNRYDFYVDGALRYSGAAFADDVETVSRVCFAAEEANTLYIDNVRVYDSDSYARHMMPRENVYNVKDFGAAGDGVSDDTAAIAAAVEAASYTGGTVLLENGVFYTGQIVLHSDMTLFIDTSATLLANMDRNVYDKVIPSDGYNGNKQLGRGIIWFEEEKNIRITGGGTINGNGFYGFGENDPANQRPCVIYFASCQDIVVENINIVQSPFWTLVPYESSGITIRNVNITNHVAPNRDGIDPVNSSNITVENCLVIAGDDAFCPKSGNQIPSRNVEVRDCFFQSYCNGIKFGTDSQGPFSNYSFEDIYMKGVGMSGIALEAVDGSDIEYISFDRIEMTDVDNAMFAAIGNRMRTPYGVSDPSAHKKLGSIGNIVVKNLRFTDCMQWPYSHKNEDTHEILLYGLNPSKNTLNDGKAHRIYNVLFQDVYLEMPGGKTEVPAFDEGLGGEYPEHEALGDSVGYAYTLRWTDNVRFVNCTSVLLASDVRQEIGKADYTQEEVFVRGVADFALGIEEIVITESISEEELPLPQTVPVVLVTGQVIDVAAAKWSAVDGYEAGKEGVYDFRASLTEDERAAGTEDLSAYVRVVVEGANGTSPDPDGAREEQDAAGGCAGTAYDSRTAVSVFGVSICIAVLAAKKKRSDVFYGGRK